MNTINNLGIWCNTKSEVMDAILHFDCVQLEKEIGFPMVVRPSYVIGGRGMMIVHNIEELTEALSHARNQ